MAKHADDVYYEGGVASVVCCSAVSMPAAASCSCCGFTGGPRLQTTHRSAAGAQGLSGTAHAEC